MIGKVLNAVGYQGVWAASVAGASHGLGWVGPVCAAVFAAGVLATGTRRRDDLRLAGIAMAIGAVADTAWIALGWIAFAGAWPSSMFAPAWIIGLWCCLALTLNHSLAFLKGRAAWSFLLGAIGGPLAYWAAARAGAVRIEASPAVVLGALCAAWGAIFPALLWIAQDRPSRAAAPVRSSP